MKYTKMEDVHVYDGSYISYCYTVEILIVVLPISEIALVFDYCSFTSFFICIINHVSRDPLPIKSCPCL